MTRWLTMFGALERAVLLAAALAIILGVHLVRQPVGPAPAGPTAAWQEARVAVDHGGRAVGNGLQAALHGGGSRLFRVGGAVQVPGPPAPVKPALPLTAQLASLDGAVSRGGTITAGVRVHNPNARPAVVGLGMSLVPTDGRPMFSDTANDIVHATVPPGDSTLERRFVVPAGTPPGRYGAWLALYDATFPKHPPDTVYTDFGWYTYQVVVR